MMLEFVGLPGAGKSTIARLFAHQLERSGHECGISPNFALVARARLPGRRGRLQRAASDLARSAGPTWRCRWLLLRIAGTRDCRRFLSRYWRLMRTWLAVERLNSASRARSAPALWIFDQGLLQCLFSIYPERLTLTEQRRLTQSALTAMRSVLPNIVVVVTVDERTAARRLRSRPFQQTSYDLASPDLEAQLSRRRYYSEEALPQALSRTRVKVIHVSGYDPPQANVQTIINELRTSLNVNQVLASSESSAQQDAP